MVMKFGEIAFTPEVKAAQAQRGSREICSAAEIEEMVAPLKARIEGQN